jgi:hypothetical protein
VAKARGSVAVAGVLWVAQVGGEGGDGDGVGFCVGAPGFVACRRFGPGGAGGGRSGRGDQDWLFYDLAPESLRI